jgi:type I restriction enzyme S subunit
MHKLFREGTRGAKLKKTEIGEIPENWEVVRLGEVFSIFAGGDIAKMNYSPMKKGKFLYPIYSNTLENEGLYGFSDSYQYPENCITITARGTLGYAIPRFEKFNAIIRLLVLVPKQSLNLTFISEYINAKIKVMVEGTSIPQLTVPKISIYQIPFPSLSEQREIAEILQTVDQKIEIEQKKKALYKELFKSMLNQLMTGKIKVNNIKF